MRATWTVKPARQRVSFREKANQWSEVGRATQKVKLRGKQ
jgi:hypothetical protein